MRLENHIKVDQTSKSEEINRKIQTIQEQNSTFTTRLEEKEIIINRKIDAVTNKMNTIDENLSSKFDEFENNSRINFNKIENQMQESTFIHAEKVQYVESLESKIQTMNDEYKSKEL